MSLPLSGVRVVEAGEGIPAAYCSWILGVLGADVIKVEPPEGDSTRRMGPFPGDRPDHEASGLFLHLNRNKRSVVLDLATSSGQAIFRDLAAQAQAVVEFGRPGWLDAHGLGYERLSRDHPALVATSIRPFGDDGPYREWTAAEVTLMALGGLMRIAGDADREPLKLGGQPGLHTAGLYAFTGTMMALYAAEQTGIGQCVEVSVLEAIAASHFQDLVEYEYVKTVRGRPPGRMPIPAQDGFVSFAIQAHHFPDFRRLITGEDAPTAPDEDLVNRDRARLEGEMDLQILEWTVQRTKYEAYREAQSQAHVPAAFIAEMSDLMESPQYAARGFFTELDHPDAGPLRYPGFPAQLTGAGWDHRRAPRLGEHTDKVLRELTDLEPDEIAELRAAGVI